MELFHAIVLGLVEGVTEFLPISSTGHLILTSRFLKIPSTDFLKSFEIIIQCGAILAVVVFYLKLLITRFDVWKKIIAAFIPTAIIGLALYSLIRRYLLDNEAVVIAALALGGIGLIIFELWAKHHRPHATALEEITYKDAVVIGIFQSLSLIPGVSRAAATIIGGQLRGVDRKTIVEFSFLLAIPTMVAATGLDIVKNANTLLVTSNLALLAVGFVVSFLVALAAIVWLLRFIQHHTFISFGIYRIIIAAVAYVVLF
jgi:undecaprenyl-diphosphatase